MLVPMLTELVERRQRSNLQETGVNQGVKFLEKEQQMAPRAGEADSWEGPGGWAHTSINTDELGDLMAVNEQVYVWVFL